jgi:hypothetical protein
MAFSTLRCFSDFLSTLDSQTLTDPDRIAVANTLYWIERDLLMLHKTLTVASAPEASILGPILLSALLF